MALTVFSPAAITLGSTANAGAAPTTIPIHKGTLRIHVAWTPRIGGASIAGTLGTFHVRAQVTQPRVGAPTYVVKGVLDGQTLHLVLSEHFSATGVTVAAKGSAGQQTLKATGALRVTASGSFELTFSGRLGATKLSGKFPLSSSSATGALKVS